MQEDFALCTATVEAACAELPQLLETTQHLEHDARVVSTKKVDPDGHLDD